MITIEDAKDLAGHRVLIAGGTTGIGRAVAVRLVREGAKVFIFGRDKNYLQDALEVLEKEAQNGGTAFGTNADTAEYDQILAAFEEADRQLGGLDALVNVAGVGAENAAEMKPEDFEYVVRVNVTGYMYTVHEAMKRLKASGGGHIVNIGSMSAESRVDADVYSATKAANQAFSEAMRKSAQKDKVRVTLIEPGLTGSDMAREGHDLEEQRKMIEEGTMLKAEDIAGGVMYALAQPDRSAVVEMQIRPSQQEI